MFKVANRLPITEDDIITFTDGYCNYFAHALMDTFGYKMKFLAYAGEVPNYWMHAVVYRVQDNAYLDIRGVININETLKAFRCTDVVDLEKFPDYKMYEPHRYQYDRALEIIKANWDLYAARKMIHRKEDI